MRSIAISRVAQVVFLVLFLAACLPRVAAAECSIGGWFYSLVTPWNLTSCARMKWCIAPKELVLRVGAAPDATSEDAKKACDESSQDGVLKKSDAAASETDYAARIIERLDHRDFKGALGEYFGGSAYDPRMADWVVYFSTPDGKGTVAQALVGQDRHVAGNGRTRVVSELYGDHNVWAVVFSTFPLTVPGDKDVDLSTLCPSGAEGGVARVRLASTEYERGVGELAFDAVAHGLVSAKVDKETAKGSTEDPVPVCMIDVSSDPSGRLYVGFTKLTLQANTVNGLMLMPAEGKKTFDRTNIRSIHTTFGNGERGRLGVSMVLGSPIRSRAQTGGGIEDSRPGPYLLAHWYLAYPNRPWRNWSASLAVGASIRDEFKDYYFTGISLGHILGNGGIVFGASFNKVDRVYPSSTRTIWWARPFVGINYAL